MYRHNSKINYSVIIYCEINNLKGYRHRVV